MYANEPSRSASGGVGRKMLEPTLVGVCKRFHEFDFGELFDVRLDRSFYFGSLRFRFQARNLGFEGMGMGHCVE